MNIILKLVSGEEIIAEFVSEDDKVMVINRPMTIKVNQSQDGSFSGNLISYLVSELKTSVFMNKNAIICSFPASSQMSDTYQTAIKSLILG